MKIRILVIAGTRPEAVKVAPIVAALRRNTACETLLCATGQHKEMLQQTFADFDLVPDISLDIMEPDQSLASLSAKLFKEIDPLITSFKPHWVVVQGDTTSGLIAGLVGFYRKVKVAHVEAGLRSYCKHKPFPEEVNRKMLSIVADLHFAPTPLARKNLLDEGFSEKDIHVTGNTVIDALLLTRNKLHDQQELLPLIVKDIVAAGRRFVLITGHRRENFGEGFVGICSAIHELSTLFPQVSFIYPVHLNPNVRKPVMELLSGLGNVHLIDPLPYKAFVGLMNLSTLVLTDSGGIQEEAPSLGKPVLVMRDTTERSEGIEAGTAILTGTVPENIIKETSRLLTDTDAYQAMTLIRNPYGDGQAAQRIMRALIDATPCVSGNRR